MLIGAGLVALGGVLGWLTVRNPEALAATREPSVPAADLTPAELGRRAATALAGVGAIPALQHHATTTATRYHCGLEGPVLHSTPRPPASATDAV
jgi:hypothetical protein